MSAQSLALHLDQGHASTIEPRATAEKIYIHALSLSHKLAVGALTLSGSSVAFIAMYMVKSAVGIDLFPGPSFMHDTFYIY